MSAAGRIAVRLLAVAAAVAGRHYWLRSAYAHEERVTVQEPSGAKVFANICAACHQANGQGVEGKYPPLAGSEWVNGSDQKMIRILLHGLTGEIEVQGETVSGLMPGWAPVLKDEEIAAVATYVRSSWGNKAPPVTTAMVARLRDATAARKTPWTAAELAKVPSP